MCSDICPWCYLFPKARSFSQATLLENCSLLGTNNVRGQISRHISVPNGGYSLISVLPGGVVLTSHYNCYHCTENNSMILLQMD